MFAFRTWKRGRGAEQWAPDAPLLVHFDDGGSGAPAQLSWVTQDGSQCALAFSPDMASCYGHRRTIGGDVVEVRGELEERRGRPEDGYRPRGYVFDTQVMGPAGWHPAGTLSVLVDNGGEARLQSLTWHDRSGNACSVALRTASPSGEADVSDLVTVARASAEHGDAGEVAANLVDASARKWFAFVDRASLYFRLSQPVLVDQYVLTCANDAPDRDPAAWVLRGSTDGRSWRTLDTRSGQDFSDRHQSRNYDIAEPGSFDHYRLDITDNHGSPHLQLESVRFQADSSNFIGYRQSVGQAPVAYQGVRVADGQVPPDVPVGAPLDDVSAFSKAAAGRFSSPGVEMIEPYGGGKGFRFKIRNVKIDGQGETVRVRGGGTHEVNFDVLHDCSECGNAINQVIIGLAGQDRAQASVWNGKQRSGGALKTVNPGSAVQAMAQDNPGPAQWVNVSCDIVVPDKPGSYSVRARYAQAYQGRLMTAEGRTIAQPDYPEPLGWWKVDRPDGPGPDSTIGTIIVEPDATD